MDYLKRAGDWVKIGNDDVDRNEGDVSPHARSRFEVAQVFALMAVADELRKAREQAREYIQITEEDGDRVAIAVDTIDSIRVSIIEGDPMLFIYSKGDTGAIGVATGAQGKALAERFGLPWPDEVVDA